ncbi:hypothetical protein [Aeromicrobium endophyticum]|nr:hypothetical protein [Aeromicrobium endophyticum]
MTQTPEEPGTSKGPQIDAEPKPEPATDAKQGVNDANPEDTGTDEPLTSL